MDITVFKNYAEAIFEIGIDKKNLKKFQKDMSFVQKVIDENKDFVKFLDTPFVEKIEKNKLIDKIFKNNLEPDVLNFIKILVEFGLIKYFSEIHAEFNHLANSYQGIVEGIIYTAFELNDETIEQVTEIFSTKLKKKVSFKVLLDSSLLGGIKIFIQDRIYDYSILNKINSIKENLLLK